MSDDAGAAAPPPLSKVDAASVNARMGKGAALMVLARVGDRTIGIASMVILARLLVPADFGLVALATAILAMLELLTAFGFDTALIQNPAAGRAHYDTAWTFNVLFGASIGALLLLLAVPAATFYSDSRLTPIMAFLALGSLLQGFENIGVVQFRKDLNFNKEFQLLFAKRLVTFLVTIPLAFTLRSYWALIGGIVASRLVGVGLTYAIQSYRPRLSLAARHELFSFGKWLMLGNALNFVSTRSGDFLISKIAGAHELGLFNISYEIANLPSSDLIAPVNRAVYPGYAAKANDGAALKQTYLEVIGAIGILAIPAGTGIAAVAHLLVPVVLGAQWMAAAPVISALAFYGILLSLKSNSHYVYLAMGKSYLATVLGVLQIILILPAILIGAARAGAYGVAVGYLAAQTLFTPISLFVLRSTLGIGFGEIGLALYRPLVAAGAMFAGVHWLSSAAFAGAQTMGKLVLALLTCVAAGAAIYITVLFLLWCAASRPAAAEKRVAGFLLMRLKARLRGAALT